jgi:hypothetical protein
LAPSGADDREAKIEGATFGTLADGEVS